MLQANGILRTDTTTTGASFSDQNPGGAFQAVITGTGAVTATAVVQASLNGTDWIELGTIELTGTNSATDGFVNLGEWIYYRANCTSITGTGAVLSVLMSVNT